ncbi:hypothetical protein fh0823_23430 [Francisella halioticida]|uniref:DUF3568 domain-containing protein n=1 Tax=Francisella halioticida TaxID=549298 RepID=A0ABN5AYY4_9GAMM|nr:DUF3568 family protein [Francisella halioticida]ASG68925.1 hypothetical protein CDV26_11540 [Francisella halioticida]BCD92204.1 hypothetical protein fh0823_23430 [Francisella halioticida]
MNKTTKLFVALGISTLALTSCSNTQMAITGLALAGVATGYLAYNWMNNPDASNAYEKTPKEVTQAVNDILKSSGYTVIKTENNSKDNTHMIEAQNNQGKKVDFAISPVASNPNQAKLYIKGTSFSGVSKAESQILLNKINKKLM